ncbi:hypothetical protein, partial [Serratia marcescens]|uniref:hypothetical protein n=1 Tax=Serratia marcescens TaxID=615 RepID=UPI001952DEF9
STTSSIALAMGSVAAGFTNIASFTEPFNPITLNLLLIGLSIVGYINSQTCLAPRTVRGSSSK